MPIAADQQTALRKQRQRLFALVLLAAACSVPLAVGRARRASGTAGAAGAIGPPAPADSVRAIAFQGPPRTLGHDQGVKLRDAIPGNLDRAFAGALSARGSDLAAAAERARPLASQVPQQYVDELRALAEVSGRSFEVLLAFQAWPELASWGAAAGFAAWQPMTRAGNLILQFRLEAPAGAEAPPEVWLLSVDAEGARPWIGLVIAGQIGPVIGFNRDGLGVAVLASAAGERPAPGLPAVLLARRLLDETVTVEDAVAAVKAAKRAGAFALLVSQCEPENDAVVIEANPSRVAVRTPSAGWLAATDRLRRLRPDPADEARTGLCERYDRLRASLREQAGGLDARSRILGPAAAAADAPLVDAAVEPNARRWSFASGAPGQPPSRRYERVWSPDTGELAEPSKPGAAP